MPGLPDALRSMARCAALGLAGAVLCVGVARADGPGLATVQDSIARLSALIAQSKGSLPDATALLQQAGLSDLLAPSAPTMPDLAPILWPHVDHPLEAQAMDMRLALTLLVQVAGATDSRAVQTAQGPGDAMRALVIRRGTATLADVRRLLVELDLQARDSDAIEVPLVIWEGATLALAPGDSLRLSRPHGAFVANFGHLSMTGAAIERTGPPNPHLPRFAPFVATVGSGSLQVDASRFTGLGFGRTRPFAGVSLLRNTLMAERQRSFIRGSLFQDTVSLVIAASSDVTVIGNRFHDPRGQGLILAGSPRATVQSNIFAGRATFNAIQVIEGSSDAVVSGNVVLGGEKSGIVVRSFSHRPYLANNIVWQRVGGGITVDRADCANIHSNFVIENSQKGIEVRSSAGSLVQGNHVMANRSAGIWISAQAPDAQTFVVQNVLLANSAGLATATGEQVMLSGNDFRGQFPRFLAGDLSRQSPHIAGNLDGATPLLLSAAGAAPIPGGMADCARN